MSSDLVIRIFVAAVCGGLLAWSVRESDNQDRGHKEGVRYTAVISGTHLPFLMITILFVSLFGYGFSKSLTMVASTFFGIFLHICFYNLILLILLPIFRRTISARACAVLWMLPNTLYLFQIRLLSTAPKWVITLPASMHEILVIPWLTGVAAVLLYKLLEHLVFRYRIMKNATPVQDEAILSIWEQEQINAGFEEPDYRLLYSPAVRTPLSIGLYKATTRVILPETAYTPEELKLIFRHELVHISRGDTGAKFFMTFCTAICWFNPFMWISIRKSSDDLELSCDETVLLDADVDQRHQYADLLLTTAGQEQGFTTCLSASATALRYRLKNTVKPRKLHSGAITVGFVLFLLVLTYGHVGLAYETGTGKDFVFFDQDPATYRIIQIEDSDDDFDHEYFCCDAQLVNRYLHDLKLQKLAGNDSFADTECPLTLLYDTPKGTLGVNFSNKTLKLTKFWGEKISQEEYYVPGDIDWDYLGSVIQKIPALNLQLKGDSGTLCVHTSVDTVYQISADQSKRLTGPLDASDSSCGMIGTIDYTSMAMEFSDTPVDDVTVKIYSWDWKNCETVILADPSQEVSLSDHDAHYMISASFENADSSTYEVVFRYDISSDSM